MQISNQNTDMYKLKSDKVGYDGRVLFTFNIIDCIF